MEQQAGPALGVRLQGVSHDYDIAGTPFRALRPVSVEAAAGEFLTIIGPSGCGKTTLLRIVAGFLRPTGGAVTIGDHSSEQARQRRLLGWVPQTPSLFPWKTVRENVGLLRAGRATVPEQDIDDLLDEVGLRGFGDTYPRHLSIGMQQRVALLRALAHEPQVLLLDEPFSALDALLREDMQLLLHRLVARRDLTAILVTHSIAEAVRLSDRIAVMTPRPGSIRAVIPVDLSKNRGILSESDAEFQDYVLRVRANLDVPLVAA